MKVYNGIDHFPQKGLKVVTSGNFDGVHLGHQAILKRIKTIAEEIGGETVILTYWPHPRVILNPDNHGISLLTDFEEKTILLDKFGIDHLVKIPFTKAFSSMDAETFTKNILVDGINTSKMVIGYDHHFAKNREGDFEWLKARQHHFGFEIEEIKRQDIDSIAISSSKIRTLLQKGRVDEVIPFLGRPYQVKGTVQKGDQIGLSIGFPTANIVPNEPLKLIPQTGVYIVEIIIDDKTYQGMCNIGNRPTVNGKQLRIEANIFNWEKDIYNKSITFLILKKIRNERKFEDLNGLKKQIQKDKVIALKYFKK